VLVVGDFDKSDRMWFDDIIVRVTSYLFGKYHVLVSVLVVDKTSFIDYSAVSPLYMNIARDGVELVVNMEKV